MQAKDTIIRLEHNRPIRKIPETRVDTLTSPFKKKKRRMHWPAKQHLKAWRVMDDNRCFLGKVESRTLSRRSAYRRNSLQPREAFVNVSTEGLPEDTNHSRPE